VAVAEEAKHAFAESLLRDPTRYVSNMAEAEAGLAKESARLTDVRLQLQQP
jgi:hypothetical protein